MANILTVEDDKNIQNIIAEYLKKGGHNCFLADDGIDALVIMKDNPIDLMILDIMIPNLDGFSVCKITREKSNIPIIMLTAKNSDDDKLRGYAYGADDYMTKPFSPKILLAKATALLRRFASLPLETINIGNIVMDLSAHKVHISDKDIILTHKEFELLYFFMTNPNQVFSRNQLLNRIWGYDFTGNTRTVDTHIKNLRQKLGSEGKYIVTLIRSGYKFEVSISKTKNGFLCIQYEKNY